tara:strand:+ start:71 stop:844 length:774 start_codon:yes stop_codon:yes gene_type:complete
MTKFLQNFINNNTGIIIRIDDIAENMNWNLMEKCEILFDEYNIKPVLGVIPNNRDVELMNHERKDNFWDIVRSWRQKGWEISMHGNNHVYDKKTYKKDYFNYGGGSEFFGHDYEVQKTKIKNGLKKFEREKVKIRTFFAPNHTYDNNTFKALYDSGIKNVLDGYGLMPYKKYGLNFIPQLFYRVFLLPFGIQSTQIHLNYWMEEDFKKFERFVINNHKKIISFDQVLKKINNNIIYSVINFLSMKLLKIFRVRKNKS